MSNQYSIFDDCFVDSFAGGGGASTGIEMATGHPVDVSKDVDVTESEHVKRAQRILCDSLHYDYDDYAMQFVLNSNKTAKNMIENGILIPPVCIGQCMQQSALTMKNGLRLTR